MYNDVWCWILSPSKYVQEDVQNCQNHLKEIYSGEYKLITNNPNSFPLGYEPAMDASPLLTSDKASYYQTIIGVMRWMVKLGRFKIAVEVSHILSFLTITYKGHMVSVLHIMYYLRIKYNSRLVLDPSYADINLSEVKSFDEWTSLYVYAVDSNPHNDPKPLSKEI